MEKKKKIIIIAAIAAVVVITAICVGVATTSKRDNKEITTENSTVFETVTDENGEAVTNESGEAVTEVYEKVPVVDENGNVVKDENGQTVTKKVSAASSSLGNNSNGTAKSPNSNSGSSSNNTTKPSSGNSSTSSKPATTAKPETTTSKPTTKPETTTSKPTTTKPAVSYDIDYFVNYAISYGKSIGLKYDSSITPETGSWDMPMSGNFPQITEKDREYYESGIQTRCNRIKREIGDGATFWVYASNLNFDGNPMSKGRYYLYIGY